MRTKSLLRRLRLLPTMGVHAQGSALLTRPLSTKSSTAINPSKRLGQVCGFRTERSLALTPGDSTERFAMFACMRSSNFGSSLRGVRFMGVGSFKQGDRAGQQGMRVPHAKADGSPEKIEQDRRREFLDKAKEESASRIDEAQEPFRDSVESGQSIGEATTELQFGVQDGKSAEEAINNASQELYKNLNVVDNPQEPVKEGDKQKYEVTDHGADNPHAEVANEIWGAKESDGTSLFLDDSDKVEFKGQEDESVMGIGGRRAGESLTDESSGSGETSRENIDKTREEASKSKARSPQAGVIVGHVASAGANALDNEGDIPQFTKEQEETGDEALNRSQKQYEQAVSGFGPGGDQNLKTDPSEANEPGFHKQ